MKRQEEREPVKEQMCAFCGKKFLPKINTKALRVFCSAKCFQAYRDGRLRPSPKRQKSLEQWEAEARECNMDYGTYHYWIEHGKTFEELKAGAANRTLACHAKKRGWH